MLSDNCVETCDTGGDQEEMFELYEHGGLHQEFAAGSEATASKPFPVSIIKMPIKILGLDQ